MLPGVTCASAKKVVAAAQKAIDGAATLNKMRDSERVDLFNQNDITSASSTTVSVPAAGPNNNADAKTKVSDTENRAESDGTLTVNEPVSSVRAANVNHSIPGGALIVTAKESAMIPSPTRVTTPTKVDWNQVRLVCDI